MNVPHYEQELDYSCLAAYVRMVLAFHDYECTETELRALLKTRAGGTSPVQVIWQLPKLGFDAYLETGSRTLLREHLETGLHCIVHVWTQPLPHWENELIHAVVVTGLTEREVWLNDPVLSTGSTTIPLDAFMRAWAATDYLTLVVWPAGERSS